MKKVKHYNGITRAMLVKRFNLIDGIFYYRYDRRRMKEGDIAGTINGNGRRQIYIDGKILLSSRLAFLWYHGWLPENPLKNCIDHKDRDCLNDKESNLRVVTRSQNQMNMSPQKGSSSKYLGVSWNEPRCKWRAVITVNNKTKHLGRFIDEEEAAKAYDQAAIQYFGEFANLNFKGELI